MYLHVKFIRNSSCTVMHCMYLLLHVIGREREREEEGRERETERANCSNYIIRCDWFFD